MPANDPSDAPLRARPVTERKPELLALARTEFFEKGYDATSTRDLARRFGVLSGSLYHHIDSKESLLFEIITAAFDGGRRTIATISDPAVPVGERLRRLVAGHVAAMAADRIAIGLMFHEREALTAEHQAIVDDLERAYMAAVRSAIDDGLRDGEIRAGVSTSLALHHLLGALNWMYRWYEPGGRNTVSELGTELGRILVDGLGGTLPDGGAATAALVERGLAAGAPATENDPAADILAAATELFAQQGVAGTTMQEIASASGVHRKATLYRHVGSKQQLLSRLVDRLMTRALAAMETALGSDDDPLTRLAAMIECQAAVLSEHPAETRLILHERRATGDEGQRRIAGDEQRFHRSLLELIVAAQRDGLIDAERDPRLTALSALGSVNWMYRWYRPDGALSGREIGHELADMLIGGLLRGGAPPTPVTP